MNSPFISVIIPNYNHAKYLSESIESVLDQIFQDFELIIVDDASTDNSLKVINNYLNHSSKIKLIKNQKNLGLIKTINNSLKIAKGQYITFLAADDLMFDCFLEETSKFAMLFQDLKIICGNSCAFEDTKPYKFILRDNDLKKKNQIFSPKELIKILRKTEFWIPSHVSLYKKETIMKYGGYQKDLKAICDWFLNYKIAFQYGVGYIPKAFGAARNISASYSHKNMSNKNTREFIYDNLFKALDLESKEIKNAFKKSSLIGEFGLRMVEYLIKNPKRLRYFPYILNRIPKMIKKKLLKN